MHVVASSAAIGSIALVDCTISVTLYLGECEMSVLTLASVHCDKREYERVEERRAFIIGFVHGYLARAPYVSPYSVASDWPNAYAAGYNVGVGVRESDDQT